MGVAVAAVTDGDLAYFRRGASAPFIAEFDIVIVIAANRRCIDIGDWSKAMPFCGFSKFTTRYIAR